MLAIGNGELRESNYLDDTIWCERCNKEHKIIHSTDENGKENGVLQAVKCDDGSLYLVGVDGRDVRSKFKK